MKNLPQKNVLHKLVNTLSKFDYVIGIILYGSFARGDFGAKSDIDIFIIITEDKYSNEIDDILASLKTKRPFQPVVRSLNRLEKTNGTLLQNMFREGKIIYWNNLVDLDSSHLLKLSPNIIYTFSLAKLKQKTKSRFDYILYGKKVTGLIKGINGRVLSKSCVMIPYKYKKNIEKLFNRFNVVYSMINIWT